MRNLFIFLLLMGLISCTEPQPSIIGSDFIYINQSGVEVKFVLYDNPNDTLSILKDDVFTKNIFVAGGFDAPLICDSLEVIFNTGKKVLYKWLNNSPRNPLLLESYSKSMIKENHYEFRYFITEQDYLNAAR